MVTACIQTPNRFVYKGTVIGPSSSSTTVATVWLMVQFIIDVPTTGLAWRSEFCPNVGRARGIPPFHSVRKSYVNCFCFWVVSLGYYPLRSTYTYPFNHLQPHRRPAMLLGRALHLE